MMTELPDSQETQTTAGNYFVANYPPFSFWTADGVPALDRALDRSPPPARPLGLYLHIPFCRKRCHFCYFKVYTGMRSEEIRIYIDAALWELDGYADRAFVGDRALDFVYFGGGTPSFLSTVQLAALCDGLRSRLPWDAAREITFECEPGTLNERKLECIRGLGVTRLSLGVENFDEHILEVNGRAHRRKEIDRAYAAAKLLDFPQINIDLIAGMLDETEDNWQSCVEQAIALDPDSITVYQMEIPFNTTIYRRMKEAGQIAAPVADWDTKRRWVAYAFEQFEHAGYRIGSAYTAVKVDRPVHFVYRDELWRGADLLSLGVSSFGHVNGVHYQNHHDMDAYLERVQGGLSPVYRALEATEDERLVREFILQFKLGAVQPWYFQEKFGVDVRARFAEPLKQLEADGVLEDREETLRLTRDGLLRVDRLLPAFFLPEHRDARYA
jgi:oxygen-independent coproporphyrinogen-3 oxidase